MLSTVLVYTNASYMFFKIFTVRDISRKDCHLMVIIINQLKDNFLATQIVWNLVEFA